MVDNYDQHDNGRIWLMWDKSKIEYGVYALSKLEQRKQLWEELQEIGKNMI